MDFIKSLQEKAKKLQKTIILPESEDPRVLKAAEFLAENEICKPILISSKDNSSAFSKNIDVINPNSSHLSIEFSEYLYERRKSKGLTLEESKEWINNPLYFGAAMVAKGFADGCVAGSIATTGNVLKAAIHTIGLKPGSNVVSSIFLMSFEDGKVFSYGDCAVVPYPDSNQLATIAIDSANTHFAITGARPNVAMLSFSTKGSAFHDRVDLVKAALEIVKSQNPELNIDGEMQFDAALLPEIGLKKAPTSKVAGQANVFIFPNLDAGNISYKITERLGGAKATGPVIQGLAKPMMDLSRGCSWEDIVNTACVCALVS